MLALVLLCAVAAVSLVVVIVMALALLRPPRMSDGRAVAILRRLSPGDLDIPFTEMRFTVRDLFSDSPISIAAWWMPHPRNVPRTLLLIHGYGDAKVGAIAWAPMLQSLGFNILAIDLRAHGESGGSYCTAGYFERHDINQVIDQLKGEFPVQTRQTVLFGISLGGASAAAAAVSRGDLSAVVLECPYVAFRHAVRLHAHYVGTPGPWFVAATMRLAEIIAACDFSEVRPVDLIPKIRCPLVVITSLDDPIVPPEDAAAIAAAVAARPAGLLSVFWPVDEAWHVMAMARHPEEYRQRLADFFASALDMPPIAASPAPIAALPAPSGPAPRALLVDAQSESASTQAAPRLLPAPESIDGVAPDAAAPDAAARDSVANVAAEQVQASTSPADAVG